jgi:hypothetical protein
LAAAIAITLNLPLPFGARLLLLGMGLWGYWLLRALEEIQDRLKQQEFWTRLAFITLHIRNEADGLLGARDRLLSDFAEERSKAAIENWLGGGVITKWMSYLISLAVLLVSLGAMLHFGLFGGVGLGWFSQFDWSSMIFYFRRR